MTATVNRSVTPWDWYGVLGEDVVVLLPPTARSRVSAVWERVDDGAGFDEVLDALISGGLRELPGFVLVSADGGDVKIVIRGVGEAELTTADGPVTVSGTQDTTWVERKVAGVVGMRLRVGEGDGAPYTVGAGLVRVAVVERVPADDAAAAEQPSAAVPAVVESRPSASLVTPPPPVGAPPSHRLAVDYPPTEQVPAVAAPESQPPDPEPAAPSDGPRSPAAYVPPVPVDVPTSAPAVTPPGRAADPSGPPPGEAAGSPAPPAAPAPVVARLIFSSGEVVDVDRVILVGRSPDAGRFGGDARGRVITVPSPHQEISSTHIEIRPGAGDDHGTAVVTDLDSTNGTVLIRPGQPAEDLRSGVGEQLVPGAIVDLGDGVTIRVTTV